MTVNELLEQLKDAKREGLGDSEIEINGPNGTGTLLGVEITGDEVVFNTDLAS